MKFPGNRIVKTAVAVFLTALVCKLIGWPPVFAVITAIVTLEPTVSDSIKKGIIRFPASAIGSFYAVLFISIFGNSPITYTLAASLTIITCYRLNLHAGLLVATITAVAMIEVVYDNFLLSFFIRLGTTTVGIVVSTLVNMFILPPNYMKEIESSIKEIYESIGKALKSVTVSKEDQKGTLQNIHKQLNKTEELIRYQQEGSHFQPFAHHINNDFSTAKEQLDLLRLTHYHLNNIESLDIHTKTLKRVNVDVISSASKALSDYMVGQEKEHLYHHEAKLRKLMELFWRTSAPSHQYDPKTTELPDELILLYELISIFYIVKQLDEEEANIEKPALR